MSLLKALFMLPVILILSIPMEALAQDSTVSTRALLGITAIKGLAASPDGRYTTFILDQQDVDCNCHRQTWELMRLSDGKVTQFARSNEVILATLANGRVVGAPMYATPLWSPDSAHVLYIMKGEGHIRLYEFDTANNTAKLIDTGNDDVYLAAWIDDKRIVYETGHQPEAVRSQYAAGLTSGFRYTEGFNPFYQLLPLIPTEPAFAGSGPGGSGKDFGSSIAVEPEYKVIDLSARSIQTAGPELVGALGTLETSSTIAFGDAPAEKVFWRGQDGGYAWRSPIPNDAVPKVAWASRVEVVGDAHHSISCGSECLGYITDLFWSSELNSFVFAKIDPALRDQKIIYLLARSGDRARRVGEINRVSSTWEPQDEKYCGVSGRDFIFIDEAAGSPPRVSKMSLVTGKSTVLYDPNEGSRSSFSNRVERYSWVNKRGDAAVAHLIYPSNFKETKAYPLVLVQYMDNGFLRGGTGDEVPVFPIADSGMFVLDLGWPWRNESAYAAYAAQRKSGGLPLRYESRQFEEVDDMVGDVIDKLTKAGKVDPSKIAFTGLSAGAQYVNYSLKTHRSLAAAITAGDPTSPMFGFLAPAPPEPGTAWEGLEPAAFEKPVQSPNSDPNDQVVTASLQGAEVETPLLINAADHEYLMWLGLITEMRAARKPVEMYVFADEYHTKWQPTHRLAMYNRNIDWLRFWLQGYEDPDASKRAMYTRWEGMRAPARAK